MTLGKEMNPAMENPVYVGDRPAAEMDLSIITYDPDTAQLKQLSGVQELQQYKNNSKISWINISGLKDVDSIKRLGELYNIHLLSIEDILNTEQQPKTEIFEDYRFLSIKTIQQEKSYHEPQDKKNSALFFRKKKKQACETNVFLIDQVSIIIMKNVLITFQETAGDPFDIIRKRILENAGEIRKLGTDYLAYSIIDAIVDEYFLTLNHLEEDIENFEDRATKTSDDNFIEELQDTKKYLSRVKRAILPSKDAMVFITHHEAFFRSDELKPFLQDLFEHLNQATAIVESHREWLSNIMEVNLSVVSHQMNKVMKVLATISTIFIPLTFVAGVYGMNFLFMPELKYEYGYPIVLGSMGLIAITMIIIFKTRRWF